MCSVNMLFIIAILPTARWIDLKWFIAYSPFCLFELDELANCLVVRNQVLQASKDFETALSFLPSQAVAGELNILHGNTFI